MSESMQGLKRTHMCSEVREHLIGSRVTVMGWVNKRRNLGQLIFIALRDRSGIVQGVVNEEKTSKEVFEKAESVRGEYVVAFSGTVCARTAENVNPDMETGKIEIEIDEFRILSESEVPPFQVADTGVKDDLRLKYRYIDLRKPELQKNIMMRHKIAQSFRGFLNEEGFLEIETPMLTKSTPEGARDYLVPSRIYPGNFYALPQSPQLFKQLLMVSGFDKYYQIVKCFRDEDLRADRQPEFTQVDIEMSFVDIDDVLERNERLLKKIFKDVLDIDLPVPLQRMTYNEAMERYGSDKPDLRFGMELKDISELIQGTEFGVFNSALEAGGSVRGIKAEGLANYPRKKIDALIEYVKTYKAKGLAWISILEDGTYKTTLSKFFSDDRLKEIADAFDAKANDLILICADKNEIVFDALGNLRCEIARREDLIDPNEYKLLWVTEFPLLEWDEEANRFFAKHHPFTSPMEEDYELLDKDPAKVRAKAYDIVANGYELGGGSLRIYQNNIQKKMFEILGFTDEDAEERFGFLLEAFKYGAPPHGGIAYGLDRVAMIMAKTPSIREVMAFPKVKDASCPLTDAPNIVDDVQLKELGISIDKFVKRHEEKES